MHYRLRGKLPFIKSERITAGGIYLPDRETSVDQLKLREASPFIHEIDGIPLDLCFHSPVVCKEFSLANINRYSSREENPL